MLAGQQILVVDDDREIARLVTELLERYDYEVEVAHSAEAARRLLKAKPFDLVILDVLMPGETGTELCLQIRNHSAVPIIMLTAVSELTDRVVGLVVGADDYIAKPFEGRELLARIRALLRRFGHTPAAQGKSERLIAFGEWRLDLSRRELRSAAGVLVPLSNAEFQVLRALAQRPNVVMSREWLAEDALGATHDPASRGIDVLICRLRSKMRPHEDATPLIETLRSGGYALRAQVL
jgi:two-component system OmpR family response regulator